MFGTNISRHARTKAYKQKNDLPKKIVLVGLPGFEFCLQNRADTLQKKAQTERSSNKPLSYRLNQHKVRIREHNAKMIGKWRYYVCMRAACRAVVLLVAMLASANK